MPSKCDLRLIDEHFEGEFVDVSIVSSSDGKTIKTVDVKDVVSKEEPKPVKKNSFSPPIIEDWVLNQVNTAKEKVVVNAVKGNGFNAVKASACWEWRPKKNVLDHVSKHNNASMTLERLYYIDAQDRSNKRSLGEEDASKQGRILKYGKHGPIFEERDFDVQAMMDADYELAARLRAEEQR
nr:hypothetical protein [Tanacetum cinerariifolium]